jgi:flagellar protein FliO/FliZ
MEISQILFAVFSLIFVISLIGLTAFVLKRFVLERNFAIGAFGAEKKRRLKIIEHLPLDARRRLMLVEKDGKEEILLLLGLSGETIISTTPIKNK